MGKKKRAKAAKKGPADPAAQAEIRVEKGLDPDAPAADPEVGGSPT